MVTSGERNSMTGDRVRDSPTFIRSFKYRLIYTYYLLCCKVLQWHMKIQKYICWLNSPISLSITYHFRVSLLPSAATSWNVAEMTEAFWSLLPGAAMCFRLLFCFPSRQGNEGLPKASIVTCVLRSGLWLHLGSECYLLRGELGKICPGFSIYDYFSL